MRRRDEKDVRPVGKRLLVKRQGEKSWTQVSYLGEKPYLLRQQMAQFLNTHLGAKARIEGVRVDYAPVDLRANSKEDKNGDNK